MNLSILNLNCWLFPAPLSSNTITRLSNIVNFVKTNDPDIVTLQEVWSNRALQQLKRSLPEYHFISAQTPLYNQSGLVTLLKNPSVSFRLHFFKRSAAHNFTELFLRKGYLLTEVQLQGHKLTIINTHLYASFSEKSRIIAQEQLQEVIRSARAENTFLCGDLNMEEEAVKKICSANFFQLCGSQNTRDNANPYCYKRFNALMPNRSSKIDYILCSNPKPAKISVRLMKEPLVSDHYPMIASLHL